MNTATDVNKSRKQILGSHKHTEESTTAEDNSGGEKIMKAEEQSTAESGRERLKRHRGEMAGRVWIPDIWGQEGFLKDWIDSTAFDASLVNNTIMSARAALIQRRQPADTHYHHAPRRRIDNRC